MNSTTAETTTRVTEGYKNWAMNRSLSLTIHSYSTYDGKIVTLYTITEFKAPLSAGDVTPFTKTYKNRKAADAKFTSIHKHFYEPTTEIATK
jgi:hypothetical protein